LIDEVVMPFNSADRVARAVAMLRRARRLGTAEASAEADLALAGLTRIELKEALTRAGAEGSQPPRGS
jgi:hypothetical protein